MSTALCGVPRRLAIRSGGIQSASLTRPASAVQASPRSADSRYAAAQLPQPWLWLGLQSPALSRRALSTTPACHARLINRPQRPYQFTQIVQLSDGSTFSLRTTSPYPLHRSAKDSRNHTMWQPSEKSLRNVEVDEAGKLAAFRNRFGRGWDAEDLSDDAAASPDAAVSKGAKPGESAAASKPAEDPFDALADLLSGYAAKEAPMKTGGLSAKEQAKKDKKK